MNEMEKAMATKIRKAATYFELTGDYNYLKELKLRLYHLDNYRIDESKKLKNEQTDKQL